MAGHAKKCVERYCQLNSYDKVATPCVDDHHFKEEEMGSVGELSKVCSKIVLRCLYLARIGRPDIRWSVNKLARAVTKWTKACEKRLARLISYIHHTCEFRQKCYGRNAAQQCRLGLFQDSDFAGDLEDSKSTSAYLQVVHSYQQVGCARNRPRSHTAQQRPSSHLLMQVYAWMEYQLLIFGIWL